MKNIHRVVASREAGGQVSLCSIVKCLVYLQSAWMYGVFEVNRTLEIKFVDETPWCYHLNETYSAVLLPNTIMLIFLFFSSVRKGSTVNTPLC